MIVADVNLVACLLISGEHTPAAEAVLAAHAEWAMPFVHPALHHHRASHYYITNW